MNKEIHSRLQVVFRKTFKQNNLEINDLTSAKEVKGWDSFMHIELIANVESEFGIMFSFNEVISFKTVGDMMSLIDKKVTCIK